MPGDEKNEKKKILLEFFYIIIVSKKYFLFHVWFHYVTTYPIKIQEKFHFSKSKLKWSIFRYKKIQYRLPTAAMNTNRKNVLSGTQYYALQGTQKIVKRIF